MGWARGYQRAYWTMRLRKGTQAHVCSEHVAGPISRESWWVDGGAYFTFGRAQALANGADYVVISLNGGNDG